MKARRSLNLLVAAAGLVFLSGCATETLTDSAFWSYLPFTSAKGGKGSGAHGGSDDPKASPDSPPATKSGDQPKPATTPQRSTDPTSEGWNDPPSPNKDAGPATRAAKPEPARTDNTAQTPPRRIDAASPKPKTTPDGISVRTDGLTLTSNVPGTAPALPAVDGRALDGKTIGAIGLPSPALGPNAVNPDGTPPLGDLAAPAPTKATGSRNPSLPETSGPTGKVKRPPLRIPELFVDGIGPATLGKPNTGELPKRTPPPPQPADSLNLPREVLGQPATANPGQAARRLPRAITDDPQRLASPTAALPLPGIPAVAPTNGASQAAAAGTLPTQPNAATSNHVGPGVAIPGAPATKSADGRTLNGGVAGSPATAKPNGETAPLPNVGQVPPLPTPPIPAPFRLSEWISNDALHQAWRRQQSQRAELEPQVRGSEQQRLRLILDTYLLREKAEDKSGK